MAVGACYTTQDALGHSGATNSAGTRRFSRLRWDTEALRDLRSRLSANVSMLQMSYSSISQMAVLDALDAFKTEIKSGQRSLSSIHASSDRNSVDPATENEDWAEITSGLEDLGITAALATEYKDLILQYFRDVLALGDLESEPTSDCGDVPPSSGSEVRAWLEHDVEGPPTGDVLCESDHAADRPPPADVGDAAIEPRDTANSGPQMIEVDPISQEEFKRLWESIEFSTASPEHQLHRECCIKEAAPPDSDAMANPSAEYYVRPLGLPSTEDKLYNNIRLFNTDPRYASKKTYSLLTMFQSVWSAIFSNTAEEYPLLGGLVAISATVPPPPSPSGQIAAPWNTAVGSKSSVNAAPPPPLVDCAEKMPEPGSAGSGAWRLDLHISIRWQERQLQHYHLELRAEDLIGLRPLRRSLLALKSGLSGGFNRPRMLTRVDFESQVYEPPRPDRFSVSIPERMSVTGPEDSGRLTFNFWTEYSSSSSSRFSYWFRSPSYLLCPRRSRSGTRDGNVFVTRGGNVSVEHRVVRTFDGCALTFTSSLTDYLS